MNLPTLVTFYRGGPDFRGRTLEDIWAWPDKRLETAHDYIQWLFPLPEPSFFNPDALLLDDDSLAAFQTDPVIQANLRTSFAVMLKFYGLTRAERDGRVTIGKAGDYPLRACQWLVPQNHNYRRITFMGEWSRWGLFALYIFQENAGGIEAWRRWGAAGCAPGTKERLLLLAFGPTAP